MTTEPVDALARAVLAARSKTPEWRGSARATEPTRWDRLMAKRILAALPLPQKWWRDGSMVVDADGTEDDDQHFVADAASDDDAQRLVDWHNLAALVRTPETLDVVGLRREIEALPGTGTHYADENGGHSYANDANVNRAAVLAIVDRLAASPAPDPGAGLRAAAQAVVLEWDQMMLSAVASDKRGPIYPSDALALGDAILPLRAALAPSAEPPETP